MNIRKQYARPNCNLILDGFDEGADNNAESNVISILTKAECNFVASNQQLSGGRAFLENLASAVNSYTQEFLSGLSHPQDNQQDFPQVEITGVNFAHQITLKSDSDEAADKQKVILSTTEFFDLVETIDCFYADQTTLPDVNQSIEVVSKRYRQPEQPLEQRVIPLFTGAISLAAAAGLFFMLPIPEARRPQPTLETLPTETIPQDPTGEPLPVGESDLESSDILEPETNDSQTTEETESSE